MTTAELQERLTWKEDWPAPFESFWSVVNKALQLNHMSWSEFARLIKLEGHPAPRVINGADTAWIDFPRLGSLLGVAVSRLHEGCWDKLGLVTGNQRPGIRLCPKCWQEAAYHCVFFDLAILKLCPIHNCQLTSPCLRCTSDLRFAVRCRRNARPARHCLACKTLSPDIEMLINGPGLNADDEILIKREGTEFLYWWNLVGDRFPARDLLLGELLYRTVQDNRDVDYLPWQRFIATSVGRDHHCKWVNEKAVVPVRYVHWREDMCITQVKTLRDGYRADLWSSDIGRGYRSLKKHLYKKFIRPHGRCYRQLLALSWNECQHLDGDELCMPALAFLVWRMSVEGVIRVEALRERPPRGFQLKPMAIEEYSQMSLFGSLRWSYFAFLSTWHTLAKYQGNCNFRVLLGEIQYRTNFLYRCVPTNRKERFEEPAEVSIHLLGPDPHFLEMEVRHECCGKLGVADEEAILLRNASGGIATGYIHMNRCLFQVNHPMRNWTNRYYCEVWV